MMQELIELGMPYLMAVKAKSHLPKDSIPYDFKEITHFYLTPTKQRRKRVMVELKFLQDGKENKTTFPARGSRWGF